jgi:hypothetical protein
MHIFTKRNALLGWIRIARRRLEHKVDSVAGHKRRRGLLAGIGLAAGAVAALAALAFWARRDHTEPAHVAA